MVTDSRMIRAYLIGILLLLPLQRKISLLLIPLSHNTANFIMYIDELTIVVFTPVALFCLFKKQGLRSPVGVLFCSLALLTMSGALSGLINGNPLLVTAGGVFDYVKTFCVIFIYYAFFRSPSEFNVIFRYVLALAVLLGVISIAQEIWALGSVYIAGADINDPANYIFRGGMDISLLESYWRFGVFRTSSLLVSTINSGLYALLILNVYFCTVNRLNPFVVAALFGSILTSISRLAYSGLIVVSGVQIFRNRRWLIVIVMLTVFSMFYLGTLWDFNVVEIVDDNTSYNITEMDQVSGADGQGRIEVEEDALNERGSDEKHFRKYARDIALTIWKDHPFIGVGPGMFGGVVSVKFRSPIYNEYNFTKINYLYKLRSIDNFWPQLLAETGLAGALLFLALLVTIVSLLLLAARQATTMEAKGLSLSLIIYAIVIIIYTLGLGLNITPVLFTYCAFTGIAISCMECRHIKT